MDGGLIGFLLDCWDRLLLTFGLGTKTGLVKSCFSRAVVLFPHHPGRGALTNRNGC